MSWNINIFPVREKSLLSRRKRTKGYGWSASSSEGGYQYDRTPRTSEDEALRVATETIESMGGTVTTRSKSEDSGE